MFRVVAVRRAIASLALVALLAPGPSIVHASALPGAGGAQTDSVFGAIMGAACGASIGVARRLPAPIVVTVTAVVCALMIMDAALTEDHH
jgi:hypothetical protein